MKNDGDSEFNLTFCFNILSKSITIPIFLCYALKMVALQLLLGTINLHLEDMKATNLENIILNSFDL